MATTEKCSHGCGHKADKHSSGQPECWHCWNLRKLDLPAAEHWAKVAAEFLSNVDLYDLMTYLPSCGLSSEEVGTMLTAAKRVREHSEKLVKMGYKAPSNWDVEVEA